MAVMTHSTLRVETIPLPDEAIPEHTGQARAAGNSALNLAGAHYEAGADPKPVTSTSPPSLNELGRPYVHPKDTAYYNRISL